MTILLRRLVVVLGLAALVGCASTPEMTEADRQKMQTRRWDAASFELVFRAVKHVLQDDGYILKTQDSSNGVAVGVMQRTERPSAFWAAVDKVTAKPFPVGETLEASVQIDRVGGAVETKLTLHQLDQYALGGERGVQLWAPALYANFYTKLKLELERRRGRSK